MWARGRQRRTCGRSLRGSRRTGNARLAAREAGMDVGTAYDQRIKDDRFAARWARGAGQGQGARRKPAQGAGGAARRGRNWCCPQAPSTAHSWSSAGPGRWSARAEGAVPGRAARAPAASGRRRGPAAFRRRALYQRRENYPDFAAAWAADEALARRAAARACCRRRRSPPSTPRSTMPDLPKVNIDQAIVIVRMKRRRRRTGGGARWQDTPEPASSRRGRGIVRKLDAIEAHEKRTRRRRRRLARAGRERSRE